LRRFEGEADVLFVEIPQIPKKIVVYRRPSYRQKTYDRLYLNNMDLPHIPLFEGEENLKLLSLENNLINKIDHLVSLNNLLYLNLYANKIYEIENLQTVPKLRALMLGRNLIEKIKNLSGLGDLEVLDLHSNKIKEIENLSALKKLRLLNLANNQITSFVELLSNKNLEEINLRKNLIVSIPNMVNTMDRLKKLNLGKNMISKIENLTEIKKLKILTELIIEDNPVLVLKEAAEILKTLPLKVKNPSKDTSSKESSQSLKKPDRLKKEDSQLKLGSPEKKSHHSLSAITGIESLPEINLEKEIKIKGQNIENKGEEITEDQSNNIISHIEKEWTTEYNYIVENGFNGYNTKILKESKIVSGHAELEGTNRLNIYGNALEVLEQEEFYRSINFIRLEYFNIDIVTSKLNLEKLKNFKNLTNLIFSHNNIHSFYQLIKFEEFTEIESITIINNEICGSSFLKFFLVYRFQNLKFFNETEISQNDIIIAKKMFEYFDKCISNNENRKKDEKNGNKNLISKSFNNSVLNKKKEYLNYVQDNLMDCLDEIMDEYVF
jgi:leucine-rich repeat-containing protein 49